MDPGQFIVRFVVKTTKTLSQKGNADMLYENYNMGIIPENIDVVHYT